MRSRNVRVDCNICFNLVNGGHRFDQCAKLLYFDDCVDKCYVDSCFDIELGLIQNMEISAWEAPVIKKPKKGDPDGVEQLSNVRIYILATPAKKEAIMEGDRKVGILYTCDCPGSEGALKFHNIHKGKRSSGKKKEGETS